MKKISGILCIVFLLCGMATNALALSVLGTTQTYSSYGYGGSLWSNMTAALDTATSNNFDTVLNFEVYSIMENYDALWLDLRGPLDTLTPLEESNIQAFIATGKRVVMIGETNIWATWNQQIIGMNGGTYTGQDYVGTGTATRVVSNELTNNAPTLFINGAGVVATGGNALYDPNFVTLWGNNVLTILDVNLFSNPSWGQNNPVFATNVSNWIAGIEPAQPQSIPTLNEWGMIIFMLLAGITAIVYLRKSHMSV